MKKRLMKRQEGVITKQIHFFNSSTLECHPQVEGLFTQRALPQLFRIKFPGSLQAPLRQTRELGSKLRDWQSNLERNLPDLPSPAGQSKATLSPSGRAQFGVRQSETQSKSPEMEVWILALVLVPVNKLLTLNANFFLHLCFFPRGSGVLVVDLPVNLLHGTLVFPHFFLRSLRTPKPCSDSCQPPYCGTQSTYDS